jgi:hypothetical protein
MNLTIAISMDAEPQGGIHETLRLKAVLGTSGGWEGSLVAGAPAKPADAASGGTALRPTYSEPGDELLNELTFACQGRRLRCTAGAAARTRPRAEPAPSPSNLPG